MPVPDITIPEEAIEAGAEALTAITHRPWGDCLPVTREVLRRNARVPLEAAAPLIVAAAFEQLADELGTKGTLGHESAGENHTAAMVAVTELSTAAWIRRRAGDLRRLSGAPAGIGARR